MFISAKRHEREKQELIGASNRLTDALLKAAPVGLFLLDARDRIQPQVSKALGTLFRRQDFSSLSFEKLIAPVVSAKTLSAARGYVAKLLEHKLDNTQNPLENVEVRLPNADGSSFTTAHYGFTFTPVEGAAEPRCWLVRVSDITLKVQEQRELEDLRNQLRAHNEMLRAVLTCGGARFGKFISKTDEAMKTINGVLKKPAREADAFRSKLEETLVEVDRLRRDAAALRLESLEQSARSFEDSLQELRTRDSLSGSDFLPLAVKLDQLYGQFVTMRSLTTQATAHYSAGEQAAQDVPTTSGGTQIIEAPKFIEQMRLQEQRTADASAEASAPPQVPARRTVTVGSLDSTLCSLTDMMAQENGRTVVLETTGLDLVPQRYQATVKNVAIQFIRNAVVHGIETAEQREATGKPVHGTLQLEFRALRDGHFELLFQDDGRGLDPDMVRATAVAKGILSQEEATRMRDRQAIKLIFKSAYTTMELIEGGTAHGAGMSLVRRYVHEAGGKIALASLLGHETRFKVSLPPAVEDEAAQVA